MKTSDLPKEILDQKKILSPMNTITLRYHGRIVSIAQNILTTDDHGEPIVDEEIAILPFQGDDYKAVQYNSNITSLINALTKIKEKIDHDVINEEKCIADGML
jgi:homoaconitase/3-isopropylmalate dehydratase large subunit|tara:strand:+ start:1675 stop:1983 length:309 start_codon:yes stop_codon:yes gene_type:complete